VSELLLLLLASSTPISLAVAGVATGLQSDVTLMTVVTRRGGKGEAGRGRGRGGGEGVRSRAGEVV
jgi:hypothetical protein